MNTINAEQLLSQMRAMRSEMSALTPAVTPTATPAANETAKAGFQDSLVDAMRSVNEAQMASKDLKAGYAAETNDASLAEVMVAAQKADLSFRAMTEVRNKLVTAYQEIMNMPV